MTESFDYLSLNDLIEIGTQIVPDFRVRDYGLLESAAHRPRTRVFGHDAYPDFVGKVAALMHSIARNHALVDGNKRLAWSAGRVFCLMNGRDIVMKIDDAERMIVGIAAGALDISDIEQLLISAIVDGNEIR